MKRLLLSLFLLSALAAGAQVITYDTIRVSPHDARNIHREQTEKERVNTGSRLQKRNKLSNSYPQNRQSPVFDKSKLRFGADLGLSISRNYTNLGVGPQIGYLFNQYFMAGAGIRYYYTKSRTYDYEVKSNLLGANLFGYFYPISFITVFIQPEINHIWSDFSSRTSDRKYSDSGFSTSLVVGGGFRLGGSHITLNYDLTQHKNSPHPDGVYLGVSAFF